MSLPALPNSLLLLTHLHLLNFPPQDASRYDEHLFHPTRSGIRERTRAMEEICYFLVGKIEGGKPHARSILPMYPCLKPSDTTAFRISLSKYLEALRHTSIHPNHPTHEDKAAREADKTRTQIASAAWWWRDVVVRKSLLEECSGARFERLILALSTHALMQYNGRSAFSSSPPEMDKARLTEALDNVPGDYTVLLESAQAARRVWERHAAMLIRRQEELKILRRRILDPAATHSSKYDSLSTDRLIGLRDSRQHDLLRKYWKHDGGRRALHLLTDIAGVQSGPITIGPCVPPPSDAAAAGTQREKARPAPLPIAAAHHPAHLEALGARLLPAPATSRPSDSDNQPISHDAQPQNPVLADRIDAIMRTRQALQDALTRAELVRQDLKKRMQYLQAALGTRQASEEENTLPFSLWEPCAREPVSFDTCPSMELLRTFSLPEPRFTSAIEERIAHIRTSMLPAFPPEQRPSSTVSPPIASAASVSRLPQPSEKGKSDVAAQDLDGRGTAQGRSKATSVENLCSAMASQVQVTSRINARLTSQTMTGNSQSRRATRLISTAKNQGLDDEVNRVNSSLAFMPDRLLQRSPVATQILDTFIDGSPNCGEQPAQATQQKAATADLRGEKQLATHRRHSPLSW
ncbi:uncharacterized protein LAESUDRAFT_758541 [Laetiporus sulphureus 93-53]|uniref:HAUS augmin-like complex subunit 6 N-terminal domain-containing protein n=1 Tax=Laetiporus sulphureus 93-53 TaxID=1314785 RepID=A0A165EQ61_9APHY|nr:uncharacterized protein LAESUDRAFT_758541 [Laetiporus sulphureus 93-53]KZT07535.1 hypothetical protein LAESUDRAFT_758541 [Laetiporus sulphureus 93-53]